MNADRRKRMQKALDDCRNALAELETCRDEERDYYDNMPESFQNGDKGQQASEAADTLEQVCSDLDNALAELEGML